MQSSLVLNASRSNKQKRVGRYVWTAKKTLVANFGEAKAKKLIDEKKKLPNQEEHVMPNPDFPDDEDTIAVWKFILFTI